MGRVARGSGLSEEEHLSKRISQAYGPLQASLRHAEAGGLEIEAIFPKLVSGRSLADAGDVAAVLHGRVDRWVHADGGRQRLSENLIVGLIPKAQGVTDPDMAGALAGRESAMEERARALRKRRSSQGAVGEGPRSDAADSPRSARWLREVSTIAAYRDRWHITEVGTICGAGNVASSEQRSQRKLVLAAAAERPPSATTLRSPVPPGSRREMSLRASTSRRGADAVVAGSEWTLSWPSPDPPWREGRTLGPRCAGPAG